MKKILALALAIIMLLTALVGCNTTPPPNSDETQNQTPVTPPVGDVIPEYDGSVTVKPGEPTTPPEGGEGPEMTDGAADAEDLPADDGIAEMVPGFEELPAFGEGEIPPDGFVDDEDASPIVSVGDGEPGDDVELPEDAFGDLGGGS